MNAMIRSQKWGHNGSLNFPFCAGPGQAGGSVQGHALPIPARALRHHRDHLGHRAERRMQNIHNIYVDYVQDGTSQSVDIKLF